MATIGERIRELMRVAGVSASEAAERSGIPLRSLQNYTSPSTELIQKPGAEALLKLRNTFGVNIDWLLTGEGKMFKEEDFNTRRVFTAADYLQLVEKFVDFNDVFEFRKSSKTSLTNYEPAKDIEIKYLTIMMRKSLKDSMNENSSDPFRQFNLDALNGRDPDTLTDEEVRTVGNRAFLAFIEAHKEPGNSGQTQTA
jgi:transcriptional regulator with XRE-family HTH domain